MSIKSVLCFVAHPDDETILAGGLMCAMRQRGIRVRVICATRGEGGEVGDPPVTVQSDLGAVRERELRCAMEMLGVDVTVLEYVDPVVGPGDTLGPFDVEFDVLAAQYGELAVAYDADVVLVHGADGEYGHPAHKLVHHAVMKGVSRAKPDTLIYSMAAKVPGIEDRLWNENELAHFALDITPWAEHKVAAMECHVTQHALFKRRKQLKSVRDALRSVESVRRQSPAVNGQTPDDAFANLLLDLGAAVPDGLSGD